MVQLALKIKIAGWIMMNVFFFKKRNRKKKMVFIEHAGGMVVTKSLLSGSSKLKWIFRDDSVDDADSGWRAIGDTDTQDYLSKSKNMTVVDFNTLANIEPAILAIYDLSVGTDLEFRIDDSKKSFVDTQTGEVVG